MEKGVREGDKGGENWEVVGDGDEVGRKIGCVWRELKGGEKGWGGKDYI